MLGQRARERPDGQEEAPKTQYLRLRSLSLRQLSLGLSFRSFLLTTFLSRVLSGEDMEPYPLGPWMGPWSALAQGRGALPPMSGRDSSAAAKTLMRKPGLASPSLITKIT